MAKKLMPDFDRFCTKLSFDEATGCWPWLGRLDRDGYAAQMKIGSRTDGTRTQIRPHRFSYESFVEPIPEGLVPDHLCRNRACQHPWHMEPVTRLENHQRGLRAIRPICSKGHAIEGKNEIVRKGGGHRCRICLNAYQAFYQKASGHKHSKAYRQRRKELSSVREIG